MKKKRSPKKKSNKKGRGARARSGKELSAGGWFEKLVALQARLRAPNGCPWDREQTHRTLRTYLIEEAYEVLDAMDSGDDLKFAEEMGDLLLQITFHSQIATEEGRFTISDVIREVHEKMVRRHPHVFGTKRAKDAAEVLRNWEQIKAKERQAKGGELPEKEKTPASLLDGVARGLPATLEGLQLTRKAARVGFDWENADGILDKIREEGTELQQSLKNKDQRKIEEELGDLLFAAVNLARFLHADPEIALRNANAKFVKRFKQMEQLARESGRTLDGVPRPELEALWDSAKRSEEKAMASAESK